MTKRCSRFQYNGRFHYLLQAGEDRYFLGQRLPTVKEDFCIWSRRSRTDFPEVVLNWNQVTWIHSHFNPAVVRIFIVWIVGHVKFFSREIKPFRACQKLISPSDSFVTEVIPDREVPQHFKHGMVTRGLPYVFDVVGTDSLLGIGNTWIFRDNGPVKVFLEGCYPRVDPQKSWVIYRNQTY